MYPKSHLRAII